MVFVVYKITYILFNIIYTVVILLLHELNLKNINDILNDVKYTTVNGLLPRFMTSYTVYVRYHMFPLVRICISIFGDAWSVFVDMILVSYESSAV